MSIHYSQVLCNSCFQKKVEKREGNFTFWITRLYLVQFLQTYIDIIRHLSETNICALIMGAICCVILYISTEFINPRVRKRFKMPIPTEFIVVSSSHLFVISRILPYLYAHFTISHSFIPSIKRYIYFEHMHSKNTLIYRTIAMT